MIDMTDVAVVGQRRSMTLGELLRVPLRRWPTVLLCALLGLVGTAGFLLLVPPSYEGTAVVVVRPVLADPFSLPGSGADRTVNMNAETGVATGSQVVAAVVAATGRAAPEVRDALRVEVPVGTQLLRFNYTGRSGTEAVRGANAAATGYLQVRQKMYADQRAALLASYDEAIKAAGAEEAAARRTLPGNLAPDAPTPPAVNATMERLRALNAQLTELAGQRAKVAGVDVTPGTVTSLAEPPVPSSHDAALLYLAAALLGGALLGVLLSYGQESLDRRVRSQTDAEEITGLATLATLRRRRPGSDDRRPATDLRYAAMALVGRLHPPTPPRVILLAARAEEIDGALVAGLAGALAGQGPAVRVEGAVTAPADPRSRVVAAVRGGWRALRGGATALAPGLAAARPALGAGPAADGADAVAGSPSARQPQARPATGRASVRPAGERPRPFPRDGQPGAERPLEGEPVAAGPLPLLLEDELSGPLAETAPPPAPLPRSGGDSPWAAPPRPVAAATARVRMHASAGPAPALVTLVTAPPAESDEQGVRAARDGGGVLVVARDRTRVRELRRLVERLRVAGIRPLGLLFVDGRD
ncbi:lipopolysaccharide biosynthesis protein [Micromonospora sp. NPDC049559]|uniref:lipopolysaccharide biosynthesis protein n=1 Tax=Micromonospora sp. NPDC049559 TaxID=3155923 RepID=UPI00341858C0